MTDQQIELSPLRIHALAQQEINDSPIANLTQHEASAEQHEAGVIDAHMGDVRRLLTFESLPNHGAIVERAIALTEIAVSIGARAAMLGGAPYLMAELEKRLIAANILPLYAFSHRVSTEEKQADGAVRKVNVFRHEGFVCPLSGEQQTAITEAQINARSRHIRLRPIADCRARGMSYRAIAERYGVSPRRAKMICAELAP